MTDIFCEGEIKTDRHQYYLLAAGLAMLAVGGYVSLMPHTYLLSLGVESKTLLDGNGINSNLLSDLRGMGGMLLFTNCLFCCINFGNYWSLADKNGREVVKQWNVESYLMTSSHNRL